MPSPRARRSFDALVVASRRHRTMPSVTPAIEKAPGRGRSSPMACRLRRTRSAGVVSASVGAATAVSVGTVSVTVSTSVSVAVSVSVFTTVVAGSVVIGGFVVVVGSEVVVPPFRLGTRRNRYLRKRHVGNRDLGNRDLRKRERRQLRGARETLEAVARASTEQVARRALPRRAVRPSGRLSEASPGDRIRVGGLSETGSEP